MKTLTLRRTHMGEQGTFGEVVVDGEKFVTGELPWRNNVSDMSSIPAGEYDMAWTFSNRFQRHTWQVMNVPDRSGIRWHSANKMGATDKGWKSELNGCIAPGGALGVMDGQMAVTGSRAAMARIEALLGTEPCKLIVVDEYLEAGENPGHPFA